ncbi:sugar nucleotide-binding protein [Neobacillus ginsengisoli]|uniref:dTDP-4-dehydrorhamnose reductase n=1 Tax=Neobacillus ginsengisoli TaxID=904295 RepID=A0ABT9XUI6_9BACI|nr:sugar nucleotide-binding protein [Neobacillus ginsengisoli]MDQ0199223.1 dTDP-4-dehydrorhamnose reductase [Neobacillus ginsengisoli]
MEKVLILGASGLVGKALIEECKDGYDLYGTYCSSSTNLPKDKQFQLDVQQIVKMKEILQSIKPDIVISCLRGEFTQQIEFHKELAMELHNSSSVLYYFSTANVFDGDYSRHHTEADIPVAQSDYGKFKIDCENILKQILEDRAIMIRIPAIWGKDSPRMNLIKESIEKNQMINVYSNLVCNNLLDTQLAKQLRFIIENHLKGIFHLGSVDMMTHGEFYERLVNTLSSEAKIVRFNLCDESGDTYYWGLTSNRKDIPDCLQCTNESIISCLFE